MRAFLESKGVLSCARSAEAGESPAAPTAAVEATALIESDERMADAAPAHDANARRGQKRTAGVAPAPAPQPTHMPQQPNGSEGHRADSPVEPAGKRGPGLRPAGHAECRQAYAAAALETSREGRTSQG